MTGGWYRNGARLSRAKRSGTLKGFRYIPRQPPFPLMLRACLPWRVSKDERGTDAAIPRATLTA